MPLSRKPLTTERLKPKPLNPSPPNPDTLNRPQKQPRISSVRAAAAAAGVELEIKRLKAFRVGGGGVGAPGVWGL